MALKIRRGLEADRLDITPAEGEFVYTTDEKKIYIGDGVTAGGVLVSGGPAPAFDEITLTPKASSSGARGTLYFDSDDDHVWVATNL